MGGSKVQYTYVGLPGVSSDLRQQQVDPEWRILIMQSVLDGTDLAIEDLVGIFTLYRTGALRYARKEGRWD